MTRTRRLLALSTMPLCLVATGLASAPWLRAFPSAVIAVPLFGAVVLSLLVPLIVVGIGVRPLWLTALVDLVLAAFYELLVPLRSPAGFSSLWDGLVHGPAQLLSFALPLVSPRSLLVVPIALAWLCGAIVGECAARGWFTVLPYAAVLTTFGLSYAATARAISDASTGLRYDTLLGGGLLLVLLLLRAVQTWSGQDDSAQATQADSVLPIRGVAVGVMLAVVVAALSAGIVQSPVLSGRTSAPARTPPVDRTRPLTPVAFVSGLRPNDPTEPGRALFRVTTSASSSNYFAIASLDSYDGNAWSFDRTFSPSGGVIPADADPQLRPRDGTVNQVYTIEGIGLTGAPWMPYLYRPERVAGQSVNIDPASGMIVPTATLRPGDSYTVTSVASRRSLLSLGSRAQIGAGSQLDTTPTSNSTVTDALSRLVTSLEAETGVPRTDQVAFLSAVARQFRALSLAGGSPTDSPSSPTATPTATPAKTPTATPTKTPTATPTRTPTRRATRGSTRPAARPSARSSARSSATPRPAASTGDAPSDRAGDTAFADVLASIRQVGNATPEQYATLTCLIAREIGVPARLVTGFRIPLANNATVLRAGSHVVTAADAWTWVEVPVIGQGWVVLDPSPTTYGTTRPLGGGNVVTSSTPSAQPQSQGLVSASTGNGKAAAPPSSTGDDHTVSAVDVLLIVLIVLAVLMLVLIAVLFGRKPRRARRRQRDSDPRRRLLGAWQESLDQLEEAGLSDLHALTSREISAAARERFGDQPGEQAARLGKAANAALFSSTVLIGPAEADAAWREQAALRRSIRDRLGRRQRLATRLRYARHGRHGMRTPERFSHGS